MEPDETDITGQPFVPYEDLLESLAAKRRVSVTLDRLPIKDMSVPPERYMWRILNQIELFIDQGRPVYVHCLGGQIELFIDQGRPVYVHCLGGIGRTGTVVGCYLRRHGLADGNNVIEIIKDLRNDCEDAGRRSPETREQRKMVVGWGNGN